MWLDEKQSNFPNFKIDKQICQTDQKNLSAQIRPLCTDEAINRSKELMGREASKQASQSTANPEQIKIPLSKHYAFLFRSCTFSEEEDFFNNVIH